jgi:hypothetical protein
VPSTYGDYVRVFKPLSRETALEAFARFAGSKGAFP